MNFERYINFKTKPLSFIILLKLINNNLFDWFRQVCAHVEKYNKVQFRF